MSFRTKVFICIFVGIMAAELLITATTFTPVYDVRYVVLCAGVSFLMAGVLTLLIQKMSKNNIVFLQKFIENRPEEGYGRRLNAAHAQDVYAPLVTPMNELMAHFERHVAQLKASNEELHTILETMTEGVLVLTAKGSISHYNSALERMFPQSRLAEKMEGAQGMQVVEAIAVPSLQQAVDEILSAPAGSDRATTTLHMELSAERVFSVHLTRANSTTTLLGAVVVFHDISPIIRLERVRRDFVANVSHELRTPLTAIQGYAETLASVDGFPEEYLRFVEIIRKNGSYLARMVEELLALARLENAHVPLQTSAVNPLESVHSALALCRRQLDLRRIRVKLSIAEDAAVVANGQELTQVFRNLLENAARYAPEDSEISLWAVQDASTKDTVFALGDRGPGIPGQDCLRIFERFYRVEKHRSHGSTGLGLAICKHTVERLGGRIWVESPALEFSTVFYFTIPTFFGDQCDRAAQVSS